MKRLWNWLHKDRSRSQARPFVAIGLGLLAAIALVAVVVTGLRVFVWEPANNAQPAPSSSPPAATEPTTEGTEPVAGGDETCELNESDVDISTSAPEISAWEAPRFREVPIFDGAGPCLEIADGASAGFAHTMTGAVQAAFWYAETIYIEAPETGTAALVDYALVPGPVTDALVDRMEQVENGSWPRMDSESMTIGEFSGYRVTYSEDAASVDLLLSADGVRGIGTVNLVWADGDWRVTPASADAWSTTAVAESLTGFVVFEGR